MTLAHSKLSESLFVLVCNSLGRENFDSLEKTLMLGKIEGRRSRG